MTKLEAVIQNSKLEAVKSALQEIGVEGMTVLEVRGHGRQKGHTEVYRGREYSVDLIPKTKLELVLPDAMVEKAEQAILNAARTGKIGARSARVSGHRRRPVRRCSAYAPDRRHSLPPVARHHFS